MYSKVSFKISVVLAALLLTGTSAWAQMIRLQQGSILQFGPVTHGPCNPIYDGGSEAKVEITSEFFIHTRYQGSIPFRMTTFDYVYNNNTYQSCHDIRQVNEKELMKIAFELQTVNRGDIYRKIISGREICSVWLADVFLGPQNSDVRYTEASVRCPY